MPGMPPEQAWLWMDDERVDHAVRFRELEG
jgi:hypothetical protein